MQVFNYLSYDDSGKITFEASQLCEQTQLKRLEISTNLAKTSRSFFECIQHLENTLERIFISYNIMEHCRQSDLGILGQMKNLTVLRMFVYEFDAETKQQLDYHPLCRLRKLEELRLIFGSEMQSKIQAITLRQIFNANPRLEILENIIYEWPRIHY